MISGVVNGVHVAVRGGWGGVQRGDSRGLLGDSGSKGTDATKKP